MARLLVVVVVGMAWMVGGCAGQQTLPQNKVAVESPPAEPEPPPPTGAQLLAAQPAEVQQAIKQHTTGSPWPAYRRSSTVLYPYSATAEPVVDCAPLRTTDLQLQTDETVTDIAIGDQERWMATPASSGDPRNPIAHIALKPQLAGIATNLTIYTTKHIYHLSLRARGRALEEVAFYYPDELLTAMHEADAAAKTPAEAGASAAADDAARIAAVDPSRLNFAYEISGANVAWRPVRAFDDGAHVYLEVPTSMKASTAPALMIAAGGGTQMVNYRVRGSYYVVDRLFDQAVLVSGVGRAQDRVTITSAAGGR